MKSKKEQLMDAIYIPVSEIKSNPRQPRTEFNGSEMASLVASVKEHGILQPLMVTIQDGGIYVLIAGERRLRAAREAGLEEVPAVIVPEADDRRMLELALIENVQRADLNPLEKARAYQQLVDEFNLSHEDVAARVGQHRSTVTNTLRLLKLPESIQHALLAGSVSERSAIALLALYDLPEPLRRKAGQNILSQDLRPANIEGKVLGGASSDVVRDLINRLANSFSRNIIWPIDAVFAVPAEMPSICSECPNYIHRGGDHLCGDEDCFHVRLNAYNHQRLPFPDPAPAALPSWTPVPHPRPAVTTPPPEPDDEEPVETEDIPSQPVMEYNTTPETAPAAPADPVSETAAAPITAPAPAAPLDWEHSTLLVTIQYLPQDGNPEGRPVSIGLRANNAMPVFRVCREKDTLLPGWLAGLLLDMETKFKES
jgi:ParB/RepB/Spo0J family partition protein